MSTDKESSAAGTDNRPPMLVESDYESWKIRIERYIRGKTLGKLIWRSIQNGPTPHPQITVTEGQGEDAVQVTRDKRDEEFTEIENNKELADIQATNILSQGLPRHVFNILNQTRTGKEIWDNVELLMKGSGKSLQQQKEELFDEYERFRAIGNESIHDYFVRFHKLINDMKITQLNIPTHQMNTKFVNNLPPYWAKYVTNVKNNKDISATTYVELYTYLKSYEPHAMKSKLAESESTQANHNTPCSLDCQLVNSPCGGGEGWRVTFLAGCKEVGDNEQWWGFERDRGEQGKIGGKFCYKAGVKVWVEMAQLVPELDMSYFIQSPCGGKLLGSWQKQSPRVI
ncbi:hypothetical protein Tco_0520020 [Tanacetum coccineum]